MIFNSILFIITININNSWYTCLNYCLFINLLQQSDDREEILCFLYGTGLL